MAVLGRRHPSARPQISAMTAGLIASILRRSSYCSAASALVRRPQGGKERGEWLTLPPFAAPVDASSVAKAITAEDPTGESVPMTALKWVRCCCPRLPMSLVQKLFRLRQVRKELAHLENSCVERHSEQQRLRRVSAKDAMVSGDVILLPVTVQKPAREIDDHSKNEDEIGFIRSLELYKDSAIIVLNKPPGMPVQGGVGITYSVDKLVASSMKYDYSDSPRLVHRLDRDSSGVLVLGRTQASASILHSIFREKTSGALSDDVNNVRKALQRKYWALVIGTPKRPKGLISAPLAKIVLEDGKSERVTMVKNMESVSSQHALTEYKVIKSSTQGYTWLELCPLTGRKHQLRVHCAEALGTPIVGDYKYGWNAHRKWHPVPCSDSTSEHERFHKQKLPFDLDSEGGSISEKQPRLHLHCRQMVLPDIAAALQHLQQSCSLTAHGFSELPKLNLVAPLPLHMQMSWEILRL